MEPQVIIDTRELVHRSPDTWLTRILVIIGPTAVGKSVLARKLCELESSFHLMTTVTTRAKRVANPNEHMRFVTQDDFDEKAGRGDFFIET